MHSVESLVKAVMNTTKDREELVLLHNLGSSAAIIKARCIDNDVKILMMNDREPLAKDYVRSAIGCASGVRYYSKKDVKYVREYLNSQYKDSSFEIRGNNSVFVRITEKDVYMYMPVANFPVSEVCRSIEITGIDKEQEKALMRRARRHMTDTVYSKTGNVILAEGKNSRKYYVVS